MLNWEFPEALLSYSTTNGVLRDDLDLRDTSYDGNLLNTNGGGGTLVGGLGRLYDGVAASFDDFETHSVGWVGWHRDQLALLNHSSIDMEFHFSCRQNFSAVLLHVSNYRRLRAAVFRFVRLRFAPLRGEPYSSRVIEIEPAIDLAFESARWVRLSVPNRWAISKHNAQDIRFSV